MEFTASEIEKIVQRILTEKLSGLTPEGDSCKEYADGVIKVALPSVQVTPGYRKPGTPGIYP